MTRTTQATLWVYPSGESTILYGYRIAEWLQAQFLLIDHADQNLNLEDLARIIDGYQVGVS